MPLTNNTAPRQERGTAAPFLSAPGATAEKASLSQLYSEIDQPAVHTAGVASKGPWPMPAPLQAVRVHTKETICSSTSLEDIYHTCGQMQDRQCPLSETSLPA